MITEIEGGRGVEGPEGVACIHLDMRHLGEDRIERKLPFARELCIKFLGLDPVHEPIPVRPVQHYTMGGINVDTYGRTEVNGLWAAGEAACVSIHGANRLGTNSLAECLVYGAVTGKEAHDFVTAGLGGGSFSKEQLQEEEHRIYGVILARETGESIYEIRRELRNLMDGHMSVYRTGERLQYALKKVRDLKTRFLRSTVMDKGHSFNTDLLSALELENMLDVAEVMIASALARTESRGAHHRLDHPNRDDKNWLKHTLAYRADGGPSLTYAPVRITKWEPAERKY